MYAGNIISVNPAVLHASDAASSDSVVMSVSVPGSGFIGFSVSGSCSGYSGSVSG